MATIEIIGSIDTQQHYTSANITELLMTDKKDLHVGDDFTGRPETLIYANESDVVKIRAELQLSNEKASLWAADILNKEREIIVHHPYKTWFISRDSTTTKILVGSICPRLRPLHIELKETPASALEQERYLTILQSVFSQYFLLAKTTGFKLDEGLSNFAVDDTDTVYYLDDEYYPWDEFITFAVMIGVFIRSFTWLDPVFIKKLTESLVQIIDDVFQDPHCRIVISAQLQSLFMPSYQKQQVLTEMINGLSKTPISGSNKARKKKVKKINNRYLAIMADIHANEPALDCVLAYYKEHNIEQGIVLGDIVGYGPDPRVCIEKLQESPFEIIKGNHDHAVAIANTDKGFSSNAKSVINWTIEQLDEEHREWLKYLPSFAQQDAWFAVHGAPIDPAFFYGYVYMMTSKDNLDYLQEKSIPICFHGHSHMPGVYARDKHNSDCHLIEIQVKLTKYQNMLICPGSVGQPRNGNVGAQCAVYDQEKQTIDFISLPYFIDPVIERMKQHGLPDPLWQRLETAK